MSLNRVRRNVFGVLLLLIGIGAAAEFACAQGSVRTPPERRQETAEEIEKRTAEAIAKQASIEGPATIELLDQAELALPSGFVYVPAVPAARLLRAHAQGLHDQNNTYPNLIGLVGAADASPDDGLVLIRYAGEGHIADGDAATWDIDGLLAKIRAKAAVRNGQRDVSKLTVLGWVEAPTYEAVHHHLVSSLLTKWEHQAEDHEPRLDYDAYALGRDGYFHLKLLAPPSLLAAGRPLVDGLLGALRYRPGKRYEDFDHTLDRPAPYGLSALVGGGLLKEPSLTKLFFACLEAFGRPVMALIMLGIWVVRWFRRRMKPAASLSPSQAP